VPDNESLSPLERNFPHRINTLTTPTVDLEAQGGEAYFTLATCLNILRKRVWTIVITTLIVIASAVIYTYQTVPVYEATATVEIETDYPQLQSVNQMYQQPSGDDSSFLTTQLQVIQSDNLAWQTIEQLGIKSSASPFQLGGAAHRSAARAAAAQKFAVIRQFKNGLKVEPLKESRVVAVSYESVNPDDAARIVNALVNNYIEFIFREKYDFTKQASGFMETQLEDLKGKMEKSQQALIDYERRNVLINVGGDKNASMTDQRLQDLGREVTAAESDRVAKQSIYDLARSQENHGQIGIIVQNELLQRLEEKAADLRGTYLDASAQYGPNYPKVVRLHDQVVEMQSTIDKQREQAVRKVENEYKAAVAREALLKTSLAKQQGDVGRENQLMIDHNILKREFDTNQQLYENLLTRLKDASISAGFQATKIHVIDSATPPPAPVRPNKPRNILAGILGGLILGVSLGFTQEALDRSVRSTEEAERLSNAPALAVIPVDRASHRQKQVPAGSGVVGLAVLRRPSSSLAESFRSLRTAVLLSTAPHPPQTLLVTSAQVGEGKTSTALNLAIAFAQRGGPILIIDADLRRPARARSLGIPNEKGLSSFLTGAHSLDEVLISYERVPNLWVMPAGPRPPDPAELLSSHMMESTLKGLTKRFTQIIIDSPPLLLVTDAVVLSVLTDGVIVVIASGTTERGALVRSHRLLENAGARILGIVLNKVDKRFDAYYGSYYGPYTQNYYDDDIEVASSSHSPGSGRTVSKDSSPRA
jgi:polysaccharide biosynthesis transport protein